MTDLRSSDRIFSARSGGRLHHRLHRLGAACQANGRDRFGRCRSTAGNAAIRDDVAETLNYKTVAKRLIAFVQESKFNLVETLVERIANLILAEFGVEWVRVTLSKPGAIRGSRDVGVTIERTRARPCRRVAPKIIHAAGLRRRRQQCCAP